MRLRAGSVFVVLAMLLAGCATAPQVPIGLGPQALSPQGGRVGVAMTVLPPVDTHLPGAGCLLCMATASMANASLTSHAKTLPYEDLPKLKTELAELLRKKGVDALVVPEDIDLKAVPQSTAKGDNRSTKDFATLQQKYRLDKLLVIDIEALGFLRTYSAYFPTSDPKALLRGTGYLVDLKSGAYEWYQPVSVLRSAGATWDEPPAFPGLSNAYFQVIELGKDGFLEAFAK